MTVACTDAMFERAIDFEKRHVHGGPMPENCQASTTRTTVRAQLCFSDELPPGCPAFELPDGHMMMEIELHDLTLLVLRPGSMDRKLYDEYNRYLDRITTQGNWSRDPSRGGALSRLATLAGH
jgi:hypothetical protein